MTKRSFLFCILPLVLLIIGIQYIKSNGLFFLNCVDPEYTYLFNGLILADMHPDVPYIDHPGTPLHCIIAIVIRMVKLFRPAGDMISDVLKNPEIYIHATIYVVNILGVLMMFILGIFTYKKTGNIYLAILVQLFPFVHKLSMEPMARLMPESLMLILISCWMIVFIGLITDPELPRGMKKYSIILGILFGLSVADKLTFLPFVVFPLFILPGWNKLRFAAVSTGAFFVFAFPVLIKYKSFYFWVSNMIFHTGKYGSGDPGIFNRSEFANHLRLLIENAPFLVMSTLILALTGVIFFIKTRKENPIDRVYTNATMGLILLVILQYVFSAKEFSYHYMLPSILLTFPMIILSFVMMRRVFSSNKMKVGMNLALAIIVVYTLSIFTPSVLTQLKQMNERKNIRMESFQQFKKSRTRRPLIVSASYYGCSAVEYALTFGLHTSGNYGPFLFERMKTVYPSTYLYFPWGKVFFEGNSQILPAAFLFAQQVYELYIAEYSKERLDEILGIFNSNTDNVHWTAKEIYQIPATGEALFELSAGNKE